MSFDYEILACDPASALRRLPDMGRVMLTANHGGVTHERMGTVASVSVKGARARILGETQDSTIDMSVIASVAVDRTGKMKDQVYPHLTFIGADAETIVSVVGLEGLAPFDAGLAALGQGTAGTPPARPERAKAELGENDPAEAPLARAAKEGGAVTLRFRRPGFEQSWTGVIESVKPAMGFINIIHPDFHLHVRGGAIAQWKQEPRDGTTEWLAQGSDGTAIGLVLRADEKTNA